MRRAIILFAALLLFLPTICQAQRVTGERQPLKPNAAGDGYSLDGPLAIGTTGGSATLTLNGVAVGSASGTTNFETGVSTIGVTAWGSPGSAKAGN
ncbi:MAG: hypothetical protein ABIJ57_17280, partial [Pseudomonadota bacterium]